MTVDEILSRLDKVKPGKRGWMALCPAHEDDSRSLSIREGDDGRVLVNCFASCPTDRVCAALGIRIADLFGETDRYANSWTPKTPEERQAAENGRLRRKLRSLELDQRRYSLALGRASLIIAIGSADSPEGVLDRLWGGAVHTLEAEAAAEADAYCRTEAAA